MVFVEHTYGFRKQELKALLRKKIILSQKARYHSIKLKDCETKLEDVVRQIELIELQNGN